MATKSVSTIKRENGNQWFRKFDITKFKTLNTENLNAAINCYEDSFRCATTEEEFYKAGKNIGVAYEKMLSMEKVEELTNDSKFEYYFYLVKELSKGYSKALEHGKVYLNQEDYKTQFNRMFDNIVKEFKKIKELNKMNKIFQLLKIYEKNQKFFYKLISVIARMYFNIGLVFFNNGEFTKGKNYFYEAINLYNIYYNPSTEKKMDEETSFEFCDIASSASFHLKNILAKEFVKKGDEYFEKSIISTEGLDMDYVFLSFSAYRDGIMVLLKGDSDENRNVSDIESEAICIYKIALVYYKLLKNKKKAYEKAMEVINLGLSMFPKNVSNEYWYIEASEIVKEMRKESAQEEEKSKEELLEEVKKKYPGKFEELEEKSRSKREFIRFIIKNYPFRGCKDPESEAKKKVKEYDDDDTGRSVIRGLCGLYHPDKYTENSNEEKERKLFYEEISKILNNFFSDIKGASNEEKVPGRGR